MPLPTDVMEMVKKLYFDPECVTLKAKLFGKNIEPLMKLTIRPVKENVDAETMLSRKGECVIVAFHHNGMSVVYYKNDDYRDNDYPTETTKNSRILMYKDCDNINTLVRAILNYTHKHFCINEF